MWAGVDNLIFGITNTEEPSSINYLQVGKFSKSLRSEPSNKIRLKLA